MGEIAVLVSKGGAQKQVPVRSQHLTTGSGSQEAVNTQQDVLVQL